MLGRGVSSATSADDGSTNLADGARIGHKSSRQAWYILAVLMLVTLLSQLDRQMPSLLVQPIRQAFRINDAQFSLLHGYAFAASYTLIGLLGGGLADRYNRRNLIICGVGLWSLMTVLAGFATSYIALLATRMGVGVGEACLAPAAYSLIADAFEPYTQGRALGIYYGSLALGSGLSLVLGGLMLGLLTHSETVAVYPFATFAPWQLMFIVAGLPGGAMILLLLTVKEPQRRFSQGRALPQPVRDDYRLRPFFEYLMRNRRTFAHLFACQGLFAFVGYGMLVWAPTLYSRSFGLPMTLSGLEVGGIAALIGFSGTVVSGLLSDRWLVQGKKAARYRVMSFSWLLVVLALPLWPFVTSKWVSLGLFAVIDFGAAAGTAAGPAILQAIVTNRMRGKASGLSMLINGLLGIGLGPTAVALATNYLFGNDLALGRALVAALLPAALIGIYLSFSGRNSYEKTYRALVAEAE
jgi:MFS family permease